MSKKVVAEFFKAGGADDIEAAVACFTDDARWIAAEGPEPGTTYHRPEIPAFLAKIIGVRYEYEKKGLTIRYGDPIEAGDKVYLEFTTFDKAGTAVERAIDVFTVRDGKIAVKDVFRKA